MTQLIVDGLTLNLGSRFIGTLHMPNKGGNVTINDLSQLPAAAPEGRRLILGQEHDVAWAFEDGSELHVTGPDKVKAVEEHLRQHGN